MATIEIPDADLAFLQELVKNIRVWSACPRWVWAVLKPTGSFAGHQYFSTLEAALAATMAEEPKPPKCQKCGGNGMMGGDQVCIRCGGDGVDPVRRVP
jgi:hypothetical protein